MGNDSGQTPPIDPHQVIFRDDGWFIVGSDGHDVAGPLATLDDVEDYLDHHHARFGTKPAQSPELPTAPPPDPVAAPAAKPDDA